MKRNRGFGIGLTVLFLLPAWVWSKPVVFHLQAETDIQSLTRYWGKGGFSVDRTVSRRNGFSLKMDGTASHAYRTEFVPYQPGDTVHISGAVKAEKIVGKEGNSPLITVMTYDAKKESIGHTDFYGVLNGDTDWKELDGSLGPFNATVKYWTVVLSSGWMKGGTVWFNDLKVEKVSRKEEWVPMLISRSFGVDEFKKGDWKILTNRDWTRQVDTGSHVAGRTTADPTLDWDGYKLNDDPPNIAFDPAEVPEKYTGAQSLKITGTGTYASEFLPYAGERLRFGAWVKYKDLAAGRADEVSKAGDTRGCLAGIQLAAFARRNGKMHYLFHHDLMLAVEGAALPSIEWTKLETDAMTFSKGATHLQIWIRIWEGRTGTLWVDQVRLDKLVREQIPLVRQRSEITVHADQPEAVLKPIWEGVDTSIYDPLNESVRKYILPELHPAGIRYVRLHWSLIDIWKSNDAQGKPVYTWDAFDSVLDELKKHGLMPMIITEPTPKPLISKPTKNWVNTSPPTDLKKHADFIRAVARHCIDRYGLEHVRQWYWECWNEPWPPYYFDGSLSDYLKVCDYTCAALKSVDHQLKFGSLYFAEQEFWDLFTKGPSQATGKPGPVPIDFLTYHGYTGQGLPSMESARMGVESVRKRIAACPALKNVPLINGEWNACYIGCDVAETSYNAAAVAKVIKIMLDAGVDNSFLHVLWLKNNEQRLFGLNTIQLFSNQGVPTAALNTFRCLNRLSGRRVPLERATEPVDGLATVDESKKQAAVLLFNFVEDPKDRFATTVRLNVRTPEWMGDKRVRIEHFRVDRDHSDPYTIWEKMGRPDQANEANFKKLLDAAKLQRTAESVIPACPDALPIEFKMQVPALELVLIRAEK